MSADQPGRDIVLSWNGTQLVGVREKGIALGGEPIDITDDQSSGWRELSDNIGVNTIDVSISGVTKDDVLMADWFANTRTRAAVLTYPDGRTLTGTFRLAAYTDTGPYEGATTFSATLQSDGVVVYAGPSS